MPVNPLLMNLYLQAIQESKGTVHAPHRGTLDKALLVAVAKHLQTCFNQRQKTQATHMSQTCIKSVKTTYTCLPQVAVGIDNGNCNITAGPHVLQGFTASTLLRGNRDALISIGFIIRHAGKLCCLHLSHIADSGKLMIVMQVISCVPQGHSRMQVALHCNSGLHSCADEHATRIITVASL